METVTTAANGAGASFETAVAAQAAGRLEEARAIYAHILARNPDHSGALANLAVLARRQGRLDEALAYLRRAAAVADAPGEVFFNLANAEEAAGSLPACVAALEEAVRRSPTLGRAQLKLGLKRADAGDKPGATTALIAAARHLPAGDGAFAQGTAAPKAAAFLWGAHRWDESIALFKAIAAARPGEVTAHTNLGVALCQANHHADALASFRRAATLDPTNTDAIAAIPNCLMNVGQWREAYALYEAALADRRTRDGVICAYLFALLYSADHTPEVMARRHRELTAHWPVVPERERPKPRSRPTVNGLTVGYVTADFLRVHPVAQFIRPVFEAHAAMGIRQVAYYNADLEDDTTTHMIDAVATQSIAGWDDERVAREIRGDGIDLLVDLSGHTRGNRLRLFGRRPAAASACFIGYPHSTGFAGIDYLIADPVVCPPALDPLSAETVVRLPDSFLCFDPPPGMPEPSGACPEGPVVFGSLNHLPKLGAATITLWSAVLKAVPDSRLFLKCGPFAEAAVRDDFRRRFEAAGIAGERLILEGPEPFTEAMRRYERIDIALDPVPYNGGTTTAHALWMGAPVVSLAGGNFCGRMGASLLTAAGLPRLIAADGEGYLALCRDLAADIHAVRADRVAFHRAVRASRLCDTGRYTLALAEIYGRLAGGGVSR